MLGTFLNIKKCKKLNHRKNLKEWTITEKNEKK